MPPNLLQALWPICLDHSAAHLVAGPEEQPGTEPQGRAGVGACGRRAVGDPEAVGSAAKTVTPAPGVGAGLLQQAEGKHLTLVCQVGTLDY